MTLFARLLAAFLLSTVCVTQLAAEVYKHTNPDGSVEFTDVPNKQKEEPVPLSPMSTFEAPSAPPIRSTPKPQTSQSKYTAISITSPANEAAIRDNAGNINVEVSLTPALQSGHKLILLVDGAQKGESTTGSFSLTNLDRGSHSLAAQVLDEEDETLISATAINIHLQRQSIFRPKPSFK